MSRYKSLAEAHVYSAAWSHPVKGTARSVIPFATAVIPGNGLALSEPWYRTMMARGLGHARTGMVWIPLRTSAIDRRQSTCAVV